MFRSTRRPRGLAILVGVGLLALAGVGVLVGVQMIGALLTSSSLPSVLLFAAGISLIVGYLSYRMSSTRLLSHLHATPLSDASAPGIHASLDRLTHKMHIDWPDVYVAHLDQPTAFALGSGTLVIDRSLTRLLTPAELEGVLAHELAHLEGYDSLLRTLAASLLRMIATLVLMVVLPAVAVVCLSCWGLSLILGRPVRGPHSVGSGLRGALLRIVMGVVLAPTLALQAYSRRREYAADKRAVAVLDEPLALARALETIQRANKPLEAFSWLFPSREQKVERTPLERALASHPPTDERISRVREAARIGKRNDDAEQWRRIEIN
ncbi:M48 family metalloprotease [Halocatena salina]|uniref:M48 family metalloprotease n=1 Tax=Halocatena salina TaxID=2934340 RepID=A0A8U0A8G1_9EURY|nr:M48 family metalloprotease [Halocatena salina]UPM45139.1 M48 family metalloprotease [Halocatena salina]